MIKLRFSVKLLLFVSVLIIGFSTVLTWFFISQSRQLLHEELKKKGFALVSNLAFVSRKGVEQANIFRNLDPLVEALIQEPDIAYVVIMNADGRVLAHNSPSEVGKIYDDQMSQGALTSTQPLLHPYFKEGESFYDIGMAVLGGPTDEFKIFSAKEGQSKIERIGGVRIGISLRNLHIRMQKILWASLAISLMLIALGIGLAYILSKGITKPIYQLVKATRQIAEGDLTVKTNIHTGDEISELSSSFDKMTENLAKTTVSRDYVDGILENLISSLIVIDQKGIIQTINRSTKELLGYDEEELIEKPIGMLFTKGKEEPEVEVELAGLSKESVVRNVERAYVSRDGRRIPVLFSSSAMHAADGRILGIVCVAQDITERKRAEEVLRQTRDYLESLFNYANAPIICWDAKFKITRFNHAFEHLADYKTEEVMGKDLSILFPKESREESLSKINRTLSGEHWEVVEIPILRKSGDIRIVLWNSANVYAEDGKTLIATIAQGQDITDRKQAEETQKRLVAIIEATPDFVGFADAKDKHIIYVNKAGRKMCGISNDEDVTKLKISDVHPEWTNKMFAEEILPAAVRDGVWTGECAFLNIRDRHEIPVLMVLSSHKASNGEVEVFSTISRDITERKRAEENLRKAKGEAEEANRLKSEFLANMSHEIRTPMNAIIGMTGIALDTEITSEQREYLSIVKESSYSLLRLLDDILDLSKIEAGRVELETIDFDLRATVESVADALAPRASAKGLELASLIHTQVPSLLRGDPTRLRQILINLAGNSLKFTEKGEVVIQVEFQKEIDDQITLIFSVTDTGIGIPEDKQSQIFESFTQADGSTTRKYGGTGLGLSISRRLVKLLGGQIGVESRPGKGSRFWFTATFEKQKEFKEIPLTLPLDIRGLRMLVVDDNQTNRAILLKMLESFGCYAEAVEGGAKALQVLKRAVHKDKLFDLVLLDMQMPEMDGEETLRAIKADPELKDVLVVILTSIGIRGDVARLEALGCAGYLTKPVKQSQLFDTIVTVLSQKKADTKEKPIPIVTRHTIAEQKRQRVRILVAEDNPMNQKLVVILLKKAGYSVDAVENGRRAIQSLKLKAYDLILMDVQMPEMNGFEATQVIRVREGEAKHTPIIAMTAHAMKGDREWCLQAGMDDYISKPIEPQELFGAIEKWTKFQGKERDFSPQKSELALSEHTVRQAHRPEQSRGIEPVEPIDLESALLRFDGDKEFFKEMLQEFLSYVPKQLEKLAEAIKTGEAKVVEREAHSLKGAAGNLVAKSIADLALRLEFLGRTSNLAGAEGIVCNLRTAFEHLEEYIDKSLPREGALKS